MRLRALFIMALFSGVAFAQGGHVDLPAIFSQSSSPMQIPGLNVTVCLSTASGVPCSPTVSVFSDQALTQPIANLQTNGDGLFPFWIAPGTYQYCASGGSITTFCNPFTVGAAPGGAGVFSSVTLPEGTAPAGSVGNDILYADSSLHRPRFINNNGSAATIALLTDNLGVFGATTSAQLAAIISDETGAAGGGVLVFNNAPAITNAALTTPIIGSAGATFNGSSSGTLVVKAAAVSGSSVATFPNGSGTVIEDGLTQTLSGKSLTSPIFLTGVTSGSGMKHQRFGTTCTTGATAGNTCTTAYSWSVAFADANYTAVCFGGGGVGTTATLSLSAKSASQLTVTVQTNFNVASSYGTVDCIAFHD